MEARAIRGSLGIEFGIYGIVRPTS